MIHNRNAAHLYFQDYANRYRRSQIKVLFQITQFILFLRAHARRCHKFWKWLP